MKEEKFWANPGNWHGKYKGVYMKYNKFESTVRKIIKKYMCNDDMGAYDGANYKRINKTMDISQDIALYIAESDNWCLQWTGGTVNLDTVDHNNIWIAWGCYQTLKRLIRQNWKAMSGTNIEIENPVYNEDKYNTREARIIIDAIIKQGIISDGDRVIIKATGTRMLKNKFNDLLTEYNYSKLIHN